ncbi:Maintenance of mitochondrial morphology protein 1 [Daldinia childiae]|uniref:Maintenance of mitochondrial morphology protein 1 n=1 Tax=Daldinia childiae TaxID=326645 RepID=UPI00144700A9|nr:Maintenance of mitochondrial morphology protein 1 [Daldinia childiae]KAF3059939.1 Maintenance of mitochondrial morphology protein 1 [Daldinia childiae]
MAAATDVCPMKPEPTLSFTQGLIVGQISVVLLLAAFIKFFIFGEAPSAEITASTRAAERRSRTLAHRQSILTLRSTTPTTARPSLPPTLNKKKSSILRSPPTLTIGSILNKTYYNVDSHQPESLDWFNVLIAQTIAQFRSDAQQDDAILTSLTKALNGTSRPGFLDEIKVTELTLGEDFPIFSNCRIIPVDEDGLSLNTGPNGEKRFDANSSRAKREGSRLQARMDVDLSDMITLALETKILLNYPKRLTAVLPVALAVSVVRFSGTLSISFIPSNPSQSTPTMMAFSFLDDYRLDFSVRSLVGSRSRLQDVPKIAQLVESRLHRWFDERAVEPRFQEIALPSLWPRKKNTRGGDDPLEGVSTASSSMGKGKGREVANDVREEAFKEFQAEAAAGQRRELSPPDSLRYRRARGRDDTSSTGGFSMPGSLPGMTLDLPT